MLIYWQSAISNLYPTNVAIPLLQINTIKTQLTKIVSE
uniref:Uncharacterized protein MANES_03G188400 n=1 Tax=Rhizophora mucronata TaxID=61149 RepID=A0A2P2JTK2_RHIMU